MKSAITNLTRNLFHFKEWLEIACGFVKLMLGAAALSVIAFGTRALAIEQPPPHFSFATLFQGTRLDVTVENLGDNATLYSTTIDPSPSVGTLSEVWFFNGFDMRNPGQARITVTVTATDGNFRGAYGCTNPAGSIDYCPFVPGVKRIGIWSPLGDRFFEFTDVKTGSSITTMVPYALAPSDHLVASIQTLVERTIVDVDGYFVAIGDWYYIDPAIEIESPPPLIPSIDSNPDQAGGQGDNPDTDTDTGGPGKPPCPGLPTYGVNTAYLNLSAEDTDFAWQSFGHHVALRRVWNMLPGVTGMFGNGWSFAYESTLRTSGSLAAGTATTVKLGSGQKYSYTVSASQGSGTVTLDHAYSNDAVKPILTGYINQVSGTGYYTLKDKRNKLTSRYDYAAIDAITGEKIYRLTSITDRNGNALTLAYDVNARLASLVDASSRVTTFSYNADNRVTQTSTINNKTATFEYDVSGNLVRNVDLAGNVISYTYDASKLMTSMTTEGKTTGFAYFTHPNNSKQVSSLTDAMGNVTHYEFLPAGGTKVTEPGGGIRTYAHSNGRTTSVVDQLNHTASTAFTSNWLPSSTTDKQGRITRYVYDVNGNLTQLTDPSGNITTYVYDANWNLTTKTDPLGNVWTFTYDAGNNLTGATSPLGLITTFTVNSNGLVTKVTRPDGSAVAYTYDSHGNVTAITNPLSKTTTYGFDAYGLERTSRTDPKANTTAFGYDPNRLLTGITLPDNKNIQYSYACNALTATTDSGGNTTTLERDNLLHVTKVTNPLGKFSSSVYNSDGFNTSTTDPLGRSTAFGYDAAHRITSVTNPLGQTILVSRNADGSASSLTNELGKTTSMTYESRGLPVSMSDPMGNTSFKSYDDLGRLSSVTNARGKIVSTLYDQDGRTTNRKFDGVTVATYNWNSLNQLASVTDSTGVKTFTSNAAGQVTAVGYPDGQTISLAYDDAGNVSSITYPGGLLVSYSYNSLNRTSGVTYGSNSLSLSYSSAGKLTGETRSNGVQSVYGYDAAGQLAGVSHRNGATVIADLAYTRNDAGMVSGESGTVPLDPVITSSNATGIYNNADGILMWGGGSHTYDFDGNLTMVTGAKAMFAAYDNLNRPTSIALGGITTTYTYDGLGNRVKAQTSTATRNFHHDPWGRLLFETNASGLVTANYIYAGSRLIASGTTAAGYVFYHQDKTGNTLALTNASGTVAAAYAYSPYGAVLNKSGTATTPFTYVGAYGVMSEGSNLYFMKNRYYDAVTGRFTQRDPIGFAGGQTNLYAYVGGNPVERIDPEGTGWLEDENEAYWLNQDLKKATTENREKKPMSTQAILNEQYGGGSGGYDKNNYALRIINLGVNGMKDAATTGLNVMAGGNLVTGIVASVVADKVLANDIAVACTAPVQRVPQFPNANLYDKQWQKTINKDLQEKQEAAAQSWFLQSWW